MKVFYLFTIPFISLSIQLSAQNDYSEDVGSQDQIISTLYAVISGDKGEVRDWDRFKNLFTPDARLIPSGKNKDGAMSYRIMTPSDYVISAGKRLEEVGFHEKEIHRKTEIYGSLVSLWSTYASYHNKAETEPFARGINSIQLMHDGNRWWIMQIYWLAETPDNPLPTDYLPKP